MRKNSRSKFQRQQVSKARRDFLKSSASSLALLGASQVLSACAGFDRLFQIQQSGLEDGILIIGGGLAGLVAALECKKRRIPFRIYEASDRLGGRIQTLSHFNLDQQYVELGADYIDSYQKEFSDLASDLGLSLQSLAPEKNIASQLIWGATGPRTENEMATKLKQFRQSLARQNISSEMQLNQISVAELFHGMKDDVDGDLLLSFEQALQSRFGLEVDQMNALYWHRHMQALSKMSSVEQRSFYRIEGGNQRMIEVLRDRVQGVIPDFYVRTRMEFVGIRNRLSGIECVFKSDRGRELVRAAKVLITIPPPQLANVEGFDRLEFPANFHDLKLPVAPLSRVSVGFKDRFWKRKNEKIPSNMGNFFGSQLTGVVTEQSRLQKGNSGILTLQRGGVLALSMGAEASDEFLAELKKHYGKVRDDFDGNSNITNWQNRHFIGAGLTGFKPGQYLQADQIFSQPQLNGQLAFAGEAYDIEFKGGVSSAIRSARRAIAELTKNLS